MNGLSIFHVNRQKVQRILSSYQTVRESEGHSPWQCHTAYPSITSDRYVHATHNGQWLGAYPRASVVSSGLVAVKVRLKSHGCACILHITHSHSHSHNDRASRAYGLLCMLGDSTRLFGIQPQLLPSYLGPVHFSNFFSTVSVTSNFRTHIQSIKFS